MLLRFSTLFILAHTFISPLFASSLTPTNLTCEYLQNPTVVDVLQPRLDWINTSPPHVRGIVQTAYQIRVATSKVQLSSPNLWDSGKVKSDRSTRIPYQGKPLQSRQTCWWQVRVWDQEGQISKWSNPNTWIMGLLKPSDWQAQWIGAPWQGEEALSKPDGGPDGRPKEFGPPAPMLRKEFAINKEIKKARAFVTGLGYFEFYANGQKVGDDVLVPNQTNYGKRPNLPLALINLEDNFRKYKVMYLAYDLKPYLKQGKNALGCLLGNGFYNPAKFWAEGYGSPRFLGQIHITYTDGSEDIITTNEQWKVARSPILMDMVYYGEIYDARKEQTGWTSPNFNDSDWQNVCIRKAPAGDLVAHTAHTDKVTQRLAPKTIKKLADGHYQVDFGLEVAGWVRLNNAQGSSGQKIDISFNSNLYSGDNSYICRGGGDENYAPRFNWFIFSGIEIKNWPGELKPEHLTAEAVNTYIETSATFETSNKLFNQINEIWRRSQLDNMHGGIASDCPHRERSAYTGDGQVACLTVMHNYDSRNFFHKWIQDIFEAQNPDTGFVPNGAPWQPGCGGGIAWGAAICIMPWSFYEQYGSFDMLEDNYEGMQGYIRYMQTWMDEAGIVWSQRANRSGKPLKWFNLGEWVSPGDPIHDSLVHTFYFWRCADITAKTAKVLGRQADYQHYQQLAKTTKQAFHQRFYDKTKQTYGNGGGNILALRMGVPTERKEKVIASLKQNIAANNGHLDTGIFGTRFFFEVLAENKLNHLAYAAMNKTTEPSFGHWIELGSTTTRERWDTKGSHNHPMFGGGLIWFYRNLAGMQIDPNQPGYKHILFKPQPVDDLDYLTYKNTTAYGEAGITWRNEPNRFTMEITVPVSCTADVYIPLRGHNKITESNQPIKNTPYIQHVRTVENYSLFKVQSGHYHFTAHYRQ